MKENISKQPAVIHVDLDGAAEIFGVHGWTYPGAGDPIFETGMARLLDFLAHNRLRATLFTVADNLSHPRKRKWLETAVQQGHEIASHTVTHPLLTKVDQAAKRLEIVKSRTRLEEELGVPVRGFRAPGYRIDRECVTLLVEAGYDYDSSAFATKPFAAQLEVTLTALAQPGRPFGNALIELPLPDYRPLPFPFSPSYALLAGFPYFRLGFHRFRKQKSKPFILLFHLVDLAEPLPREVLPNIASRIFTLSLLSGARKQKQCQKMVDLVRQHYQFKTTQELLDDLGPA